LGDFSLRVAGLSVGAVAWGYGPRRKVLDQILIDAAVEAGAEFRDGLRVEDFMADAGRITGIRGRRQGVPLEVRAGLTIGADGRSSRLARFVRAAEYHVAPSRLCYYFSYWADVPHSGFENYRLARRVIFAHPTNDGLFTLFVGWPAGEHAALRRDIEGALWETLDRVPELAARVRAGRRVERLYGAVHLPNFFRKPHGNGWALVGDAGYHKDPYLALGVSDALRDAELLSNAVHRGSGSGAGWNQALAEYETQRNQAALPHYELNLRLADLSAGVPEELQAIRAAVRDDPVEAHNYCSALYGLMPAERFFNPENLGRLLRRDGVPAAASLSARA
jgi:flavin-dependent dehydrogenase